jgi:hypothetical protein
MLFFDGERDLGFSMELNLPGPEVAGKWPRAEEYPLPGYALPFE